MFIARFNVVWNEGHAIFALKDIKQKKYEYMEYYYDIFLQLCGVMPNWQNDIYLREIFCERSHTKLNWKFKNA